ncbi:hypothetical protein AB0D38_16555 [Streptomyces sp. NPDC048279]|uniref:hypothetical protein n=1 Tax=Streptomyces sp. NPDC048279 TaxID=3154714 RepID=UPI003416FA3F
MTDHALEITLTRSLTPEALCHASRVMPLAASHDATRLMALVRAKTPRRAAHRLRHQLDDLLPIDVITTHYPDADRKILLNTALPPATLTALRTEADRASQSPERFLEHALHQALAEHAEQEIARLSHTVRLMLAGSTPAHLLSAVGHALTRLPESPMP